MKTAIKTQVLAPGRGPLIEQKDFPEVDPNSVNKHPFTQTAAYSIDPIYHPAEFRFRDVCRQWNPTLMIQQVIENRQDLVLEVFQIRRRIRKFVRLQYRQKLPETAPDRTESLRTIGSSSGSKAPRLSSAQMKEQILFQKLTEAFLLILLEMIRVE